MPKPRPKQTKKEAYRQEHNDLMKGEYDRGRRRIRLGDSGGDWDAEETFAGARAGQVGKKRKDGWNNTVGQDEMNKYYKEQNDKEKK